jgi:ribonuclease P protein component
VAGESSPIGAGKGVSAFPLESPVTPTVAHLKRRSDFLRIARDGRKWVAPGLILQMRSRGMKQRGREPLPPIRVGFTASRRVGNAVSRNRVRRRLKSAVREVLAVHAKPDRDYVVIGRTATLKRPYAALLNDLETALKRVGAYAAADKRAGGGATGDSRP